MKRGWDNHEQDNTSNKRVKAADPMAVNSMVYNNTDLLNQAYTDLVLTSGTKVNNYIFLQDNLILTDSTGEFKPIFKDKPNSKSRVFLLIEEIFKNITKRHITFNCDAAGNVLKDRENFITRAITDEFAFYTNSPFTLEEFESLQNKVYTLAKTQPQNCHFILSSFAVKTTKDIIMNVVVHIECGENPKMCFIVKNDESNIDPVYRTTINNQIKNLKNLNPDNTKQSDLPKININHIAYDFTLNNVIECRSSGGKKFLSCVDICLDHQDGIAKNNLLNFFTYKQKNHADLTQSLNSKLIPLQCAHTVTSRYIEIIEKSVAGMITHADAKHFKDEGDNAPILDFEDLPVVNFGYAERDLIITKPRICGLLAPTLLDRAKSINKDIIASNMKAITPVFATTKIVKNQEKIRESDVLNLLLLNNNGPARAIVLN
ncbi:MAG: hypothetical protein JSS07_11065 [Proteobacteria bacterium]|nr:hypothetical protein [Pseudomonadota bacterium]